MNLHTKWKTKERKNRIKVNHLRLVTSERVYTNSGKLPRRPHRRSIVFTFLALCLVLAIECDMQTIRIPCSNHLMATRIRCCRSSRKCLTQISIFDWLILMHTRRTRRTNRSRGSVWCERKKQLKARNAMVDGACHSQTALNSHRKYRCLN